MVSDGCRGFRMGTRGMSLLKEFLKIQRDVLSLEGRGFFSCVSVFFNLLLSNLVTSSRSGLSDMMNE